MQEENRRVGRGAIWLTMITAVAWWQAPGPGWALNTGGEGVRPVPLHPTPVVIVAETIAMDEVDSTSAGPEWDVRADYKLWNPTRRPARVELVLPRRSCADAPWSGLERKRCERQDLHIVAGGRRMKPRVVHATVAIRPLFSRSTYPRLVGGMAFRLVVPPRRTQLLTLRYRFIGPPSGGVSIEATYVPRPGARSLVARGPFQATVHISRWELFRFPLPYRLMNAVIYKRKSGAKYWRIELFAKNSSTLTDLTVATRGLAGRMGVTLRSGRYCPFEDLLTEAAKKSAARVAQFLAPWSNAELKICRHLPAAMSGLTFRNPALRRFFYRPPALRAVSPRAKRDFFEVLLHENPRFKKELITTAERRYTAHLNAELRRRRDHGPWRPPDGGRSPVAADGGSTTTRRAGVTKVGDAPRPKTTLPATQTTSTFPRVRPAPPPRCPPCPKGGGCTTGGDVASPWGLLAVAVALGLSRRKRKAPWLTRGGG